jgi:O-antigen ligase
MYLSNTSIKQPPVFAFGATFGIIVLFAGLLFFGGHISTYLIAALGLLPPLFALLTIKPWLGVFLTTALSGLYLIGATGIDPGELAFFSAYSLFILPTTGILLLKGDIPRQTTLDAYMVVLMLLIPYGAIVGLLNNASPEIVFNDIRFFMFLLAYPALMLFMKHSAFRSSILIALLFVSFTVLIENFYNYQEIILNATMEWQAQKARSTTSEFVLMTAAVFFFALGSTVQSFWKRLLCVLPVIAFIAGLIITQSRGFWVACLVSFLVVFLISSRFEKGRVLLVSLITSMTVGLMLAIFSQEYLTVIGGLGERVASFSSLGLDISLIERARETKTIVEMIGVNPIAGYGLGVEYDRWFLVPKHIESTSYIHNGYLNLWFKFGIAGLLLILGISFQLLKKSYRFLQQDSDWLQRTILKTIIASWIGSLLVSITSPQFYSFDGIMLLVIFCAFISHRTSSQKLATSVS